MPWSWAYAPSINELDFSNELLYLFVGQEASKIQEVKKKIANSAGFDMTYGDPAETADFFSTPNFDLK